ncbi:MAG: hypothetical protein WD066_00080 [Planctomycetaceae bacterium]
MAGLRTGGNFMIPFVMTALGLFAGSAAAQEKAAPPDTLNGLPLLFSDDFESGNSNPWVTTDPTGWRIVKTGDNHVFDQHKADSEFTPPVRSPLNRALVRDLVVGDFILDVKLKSTAKDYAHRSLVLFFGHQDDSHLHYVHFGKKADDHSNQIFIVHGEPRVKISTTTSEGTAWDDEWHHARIIREVESGKIEVYFDDMEKPVMTAIDKRLTWGRVGVGSFDDTGWFDDVRVYGRKVDPAKD